MKSWACLPGLLALVILAGACLPAPQIRNEAWLHDTSLISGEPCEAPCWRGITPGSTSWQSALNTVEDDTTLSNVETQAVPDSEAQHAAWNQKDGELCCEMVSDEGETVSVLFLRVAPAMTVGEVIEIHGSPTYAVGNTLTNDQATIELVYPEVPMVVSAFVAGPETGAISESSEVVAVMYLAEDKMSLLTQMSNLHEWEGYQPYSTYAGDAEDAQFEVTPSITLTPSPTPGG